MTENDPFSQLTIRQRRTVVALLSTSTITGACVQAGVSKKTVYRWMLDESFQQALLVAEGQAIDQATRRLLALQDKAINTFERVLDDPKSETGAALRAAQAVLDYSIRLRELRNMEARLDAMEQELSALRNPQERWNDAP